MSLTAILQIADEVGRQAEAIRADQMSQAQLCTALDLLKAGDFRPGVDWKKAHQICQTCEGDPLFDWLHALVHRIEGDEANAAYWYRRAGRTQHPGSVEEEWRMVRAAAE